jgi:hypothetical protein
MLSLVPLKIWANLFNPRFVLTADWRALHGSSPFRRSTSVRICLIRGLTHRSSTVPSGNQSPHSAQRFANAKQQQTEDIFYSFTDTRTKKTSNPVLWQHL